jgi:hypothetical protein
MSHIPQLYDLVEYSLSHPIYGTITIEEPIGWTKDLVNIKRSTKNFSVVTVYNLNFEFILDGAAWIKSVYKNFGLQAQITIRKRVLHPNKQEVLEIYKSVLDGYSYKTEGTKIKVNSLESELAGQIKGYGSEKVELSRTESISGADIGTLNTRITQIDGKEILLVSKWEQKEEYQIMNHFGSNAKESLALLLDATQLSDSQAFDVTDSIISDGGDGFPGIGNTQAMFYSIADQDRKLSLEIDVDLLNQAVYNGTNTPKPNSMQNMVQELYLYVYEDQSATGKSQHVYKRKELLASSNRSNNSQQPLVYYQNTNKKQIYKGESWQLGLRSVSYGDREDMMTTINKATIVVTEDSFADGSQTRTILPFELFERLLRIMTGNQQNVLVSDFFGRTDLGYDVDGPGAYMGITSGFYARGFTEIDNPLSTSWKDAVKSFQTVANVSYAIERRGLQEFVRIEPLEYFFTDKTTVLDRVISNLDIKTQASAKYSFSALGFGSEKGGDEYEEAVGLDEPNGQFNWLTNLSRAEQKYIRLSKYRLDGTAMEFARRKSKLLYGTEDTPYDNDIMLMDLKTDPFSSTLKQRLWADDYAERPRGVYSPDTLTNIRFSPRELFRRHEWFIKSCLVQYPDEFVRFGSPVGNADLILDGVLARDDIKVSSMARHRLQNISIEFPYETGYELEQEILDNIYGIFEIRDDKGLVYKFRLFSFKEGKYKGQLIDGIQ